MKDLGGIQSLKDYIRKGVIKKMRPDAEEREEERHSKENNKQSDQEIMQTESQDMLSACGEIIFREKDEGMELDDLTKGRNQLAVSDDGLLENKESLLNVEVTIKNRRHEGDVKKESSGEINLIDGETQINKEEVDIRFGTEQPMELCPVLEPDMTCGAGSESHQSLSINQQAPSPWFKIWGTAHQTVAVAAVGTSLYDNFLSHMTQVPANGILVRNEAQFPCPLHNCEQPQAALRPSALQDENQDLRNLQPCAGYSSVPQTCSLPSGQSALQREKVFIRLSVREQQEAMQRLTDLQREAELKCASDRRRQMLRFQERLSIARNRKSEVDLMGITQRRSPQLSPEPMPEGDVERQKSAVREHLQKMKRERTYLMQTRRDRNMSSFRELLDPVLTRNKREDSGSELRGAEGL
ncbi:uncharacterized protein LOC142149981 [Mixophyes fleayi]|uniref:uncharacterized protein LOC142149981 n=1 Tax=Mixophyes fleayi TaxID=3061075 RepID=UPI003F4DD1C8